MKTKYFRVLLVLMLSLNLFYSQCKKDVSTQSETTQASEENTEETGDTTDKPGEESSDEQSGNVNKTLLLTLVNEQRAQGCNCGPQYYNPAKAVQWNDKLELAAQKHCDDMQEKNYFSHTSKDGRKPGERIKAAGYSWSTYGENIGNGYANERAVIKGWLGSKGHCKNIMNPEYSDIGIARSSNGKYWTLIIAKPQ